MFNPQSTKHNNAAIYANNLDPDETSSNLASNPGPSCLTLMHFHKEILGDFETL